MPLEKCPACGSEAKFHDGNSWWCVLCTKDGCEVTGPLNDSEDGDKWNAMCRGIAKRAAESAPIPCTSDNTHVGAVVRLNSGGPEMTVWHVDEFVDSAVFYGHTANGDLVSHSVPLSCLTLVRPATKGE